MTRDATRLGGYPALSHLVGMLVPRQTSALPHRTGGLMPNGDDVEPPDEIVYDLEEALDVLTALEEASATLLDTEHLAGVLLLDGQIRVLHRKLRLDDGGSDAG